MKNRVKITLLLSLLSLEAAAQPGSLTDSVPASYFFTRDKQEYLQKLEALPCGIAATDELPAILQKLEDFLRNFEPQAAYPDDGYARASNLQALKSVKEGGYGIGAVLVNAEGEIIFEGHNEQLQRGRSDLHGEMTLLSDFEDSDLREPYMQSYTYKPGMVVFSSAEPCPMCFIRLATAGVATRYCTPGPDDGMVNRVDCLPGYWRELAAKSSFSQGKCSPVMQKIAHLLFFSYLLDGRGP